MKVLSKENEQLVDVALAGGKNEPIKAQVNIGDMVIDAPDVETTMTRAGDCLETAIRIPGMLNFKLLLEPSDIKAMKSLMSKDVLRFMMKAFF